MLLYDNPDSGNCYKVRLLFAHLGLSYERIAMSSQDRSNRAQVLQWQFFEQYDHEPNVAVARNWLRYRGTPVDPVALAEKQKLGYKAFDAMEQHLSERQFFVGETYTLADISLYAYTHVAHEGGFDLGRFPRLQAWLGRVAAQPGHVTIET